MPLANPIVARLKEKKPGWAAPDHCGLLLVTNWPASEDCRTKYSEMRSALAAARSRRGQLTRRERPRPRLGNRGSLPSNAAAHVACWRCVPVVPGRGGMCGVPAAHLARRMLQQLPSRARELSPHVTAAGCLSRSGRDRAACGVTEGGLLPFGTL